MNHAFRLNLRFTLLSVLAIAALPLLGQPGSPKTGINATFSKLFGEHKAFSAAADVRIEGSQKMTMPMQLSLLDTQMRMEVELSKVRSAEITESSAEMFKAMGMDRVITISRLDKKSSLIIFPGLQATLDTPMPEEEADSLDGDAKVVSTELGKETIDGHPCIKNKFVITDKKGRKQEGTVWNATDLKNFPIQIKMPEKDNQVTIKFADIKFQKPDAKLFVLPTGFKQYGSMAELMGAIMLRAISGGGN